VRQSAILHCDVHDSALLDLNACEQRNNGIDARTIVAGPEYNHAFSAAGYFNASSRKSRRSAQGRFWCGATSELREAACGGFCCRSRLKAFANNDSLTLTR